MADRYWVGGTGNWSDYTNHWSASSGGAGGAALPTSADNVIFDTSSSTANAAYTVTFDGTQNCLDFTMNGPGSTNKVTLNGAGRILNCFGGFDLAGGTSEIIFGVNTLNLSMRATSGSHIINYNGLVSSFALSIGGAGAGATFTLTSDYETSSNGSGFTYYAGTFVPNGKKVTLTGVSNILMVGNSGTFYDLEIKNGAATHSVCTITNSQTITNNLTITGNSATNRILIRSNTRGNNITLDANAVIVSNADFQDITGAGDADWDLSAITGLCADGGGNADITFTTPADMYYYKASGAANWSTVGNWFLATAGGGGAGRVPLISDKAIFDSGSFGAASMTVTQDMGRIPDTTFDGVTNNPTFTTNKTTSVFGGLVLDADMTLTASTQTYYFEGRGSYFLKTAGHTWVKDIRIEAPGGTLTLTDAFTSASTERLYFTSGTFDANDQNVTAGYFGGWSLETRVLNMGSGLWTLNGNYHPWDMGYTTGLTVNAETSTIKLTGTLTGEEDFRGGGFTYNDLWNATTGAFAIIIEGSNTFADLKIDADRSVKFTDGTTQTVSSLTAIGTSGNEITLTGTSTAGWTISDSTGTNAVEYCDISYSTAEGGATWTAINSINSGNNSGWIFPEFLDPNADDGTNEWTAVTG